MATTRVKTKSRPVTVTATKSDTTFTRYVVDGPLVPVIRTQLSSRQLVGESLKITTTSTKPWPLGKPTANTPHRRERYTQVPISGHYTAYGFSQSVGRYVSQVRSGCSQVIIGGGNQSLIVSPEFPPKSALDAKMRLKLKSGFNAAVAMAEVQEAVDTIARRASSIYKSFRSLRQGNIKRALAILKNPKLKQLEFRDVEYIRRTYRSRKQRKLASQWLELQYGWLPMLNDIKNAVEHSQQSIAVNPVRVKASVREIVQKTVRGSYSGSEFQTSLLSTTTISGVCERRMTLFYAVDEGYLNSISSVGLMNPATVAWEILPFSFVVDWFLPVGNFLDSLDATTGLTFLSGSEVTHSRLAQKTVYEVPKTSTSANGYFIGSITSDVLNRQPIGGFPSVSHPRFKNPISTLHAANALALVVSTFKK